MSKIKNFSFRLILPIAKILKPNRPERLLGVKRVINWVFAYWKKDFVFVDGLKLWLDPVDSLRLSVFGNWEPTASEFFENRIRPGDVVIDVGAHIGWYTLLAAKHVGKAGKVYAFEPNSDRFKTLKKNVTINQFTNVTAVNKAVLFFGETSCSCALVRAEEAPIVDLDHYLGMKRPRVDIIKIDVDGREIDVLHGMRKILNANRSIEIFIEFWPEGLARYGRSGEGLLSELSREGFHFFQIDERIRQVYPVRKKELIGSFTAQRGNYCNLFCLRQRNYSLGAGREKKGMD